MTLEIVHEVARLREIEPQWTALVESDPESTPFQFPSWLLSWWAHFGSGLLHVLLFWSGTQLAAVLPCFRHHWKGRCQLTLIGSGITDYLDPPIVPHITGDVVCSLQKHLADWPDWDVCVWQDLSAATPLARLRGAQRHPDIQCSETRLTRSFDVFWEQRSKDLRRNVRRYSQRARDLGAVEFEVSDEATPELLTTLVRLHTLRWKEQGQSGMIAANRSEGFLRAVGPKMAREDRLRFFALRFRRELVAVIMALRYRNKIYGYMSAFDPDFDSLGFGRTLLYEAFRHAYSEGFEAWNFLRGDEPYKASWGALPIDRCRIVIEKERVTRTL